MPPGGAGTPPGPSPPRPRRRPEFRSGECGGADLPPFTPMDGASFAPAIASTMPTMNHSFLILSSSLMLAGMGGFCLFVCLSELRSLNPGGASAHFALPL